MKGNRVRIKVGDVVKLQLPMSKRISPTRTKSAETIEEVYAVVECIDDAGQEVIFRFTQYEFGETTMMHCCMSWEDVADQTGRYMR